MPRQRNGRLSLKDQCAPRSSTRRAAQRPMILVRATSGIFPRGHAHVIETLGDKPCHFILVFDNGYFSEFGTFSITDWLGHAPKELLAKNFGVPASTLTTSRKTRSISPKGKSRRRCPPFLCKVGRRHH